MRTVPSAAEVCVGLLRGRVWELARYNAPLYAVIAATTLLGTALVLYFDGPVAWTGAATALVASWYGFASLAAFHWMFDRSPLLEGRWLQDHTPARWVQVSLCLEETTLPLDEVFPDAEGRLLDLFAEGVTDAPAAGRARRGAPADALPSAPDALPVEDAWADLVVVTLAAHELRDRQAQQSLFHELRRVTAEGGRIVLIEHLRDLQAALAFGPGMFHFYGRSHWLGLVASTGLRCVDERSLTPFVRVFTLAVGST